MRGDVLLLESDERYARHTFRWFHPTHFVITNLYRDQLQGGDGKIRLMTPMAAGGAGPVADVGVVVAGILQPALAHRAPGAVVAWCSTPTIPWCPASPGTTIPAE